MYSLLANEILGLPLWAFILIVAAAVLLVVIIIVVAAVVSKKKHRGEDEEGTPVKDDAKESKSAEPEEKPAEEKESKPAEKPAEKPAPKAESKPAAKPAAKAESKPAAKQESKTEAKADDNKAKPANKVYHIAKRKDDGMWQIKAAGGGKAIKLFKTQKEAIAYCKTLAENQDASIMIHKEDGSFRKLTY